MLEAAGIPEPKTVNGVVQTPMEGVSMVYTFDDAKAADRHKTQYFEIFGNRAIYSDGWVAATVHKAPWEAKPRHKLTEDVWELYNVDEDFSESNDLAAQQSRQAQGAAGAVHEGSRALPRAADRRPVDRALRPRHGGPAGPDGRPQVADRLRRHDRHDGERLHQREEPVGDDHGRRRDPRRRRQRRDPRPRAAASAAGASTSRTASRPTPTTSSASRSTRSTAASGWPPGKATITLDFAYDGNGRGKGGTATISVNGKKVGSGRVEQTNANIFSADDAADVGVDEGTNVSSAYQQHGNKFTGRIEKVRVDVK